MGPRTEPCGNSGINPFQGRTRTLEGYPLPPNGQTATHPLQSVATQTPNVVQLLQQKLMLNLTVGPGPIQEDRVNPGRVSFGKCFRPMVKYGGNLSYAGSFLTEPMLGWGLYTMCRDMLTRPVFNYFL